MSGLKRMSRWVVPVSGLTMALAGVVLLAADGLGEAPPRPAPTWAQPRPQPSAAPPTPTPAQVPSPAPLVLAPSAPSAPGDPGRALTRAVREPSQPRPTRPTRPIVRETAEVLRASRELTALALAPDLLQRLRLLDEQLAGLPSAEALQVLAGLLDSELPGTFSEAESLRLALLGKVASHQGSQADGLLLERLEPKRPRPERLAAVDALRARESARNALASIAADDHDVVVQQRARWALQRTP